MERTLVLFDFDGTITSKDTLFSFTSFAVSKAKYLFGLLILSPILVLHKIRVIGAHKTKEIFLKFYFKGMSLDDFNNKGRDYAKVIDDITRPMAAERIREHKRARHRIVIVSASAENWIRHWASMNRLELLATKLQVVDGKLTGLIDGENCNAQEKVKRIESHLHLADYDEVIVYGDSKGDRPMLALGTRTYYKPFREG